VKLCTYFAACEIFENASGPTTGKSSIFPKRDVETGQSEGNEGDGGQPMRKTFKGFEADDFPPGAPLP